MLTYQIISVRIFRDGINADLSQMIFSAQYRAGFNNHIYFTETWRMLLPPASNFNGELGRRKYRFAAGID